jgi:hypothetical protein
VDVEIRETHSAIVALVGDRVYKVKKPLRLPFLDFSTAAARRRVAHREVELNRRLAPDVYLGVGEWRAPDQEPEPVVVMRRMPAARRLATLVETGAASFDHVRAIARAIAAFHARAERSPRIDTAGHPSMVTTKFETDVAETRDVAPGVLDPRLVDDIGRLGRRYLAGRHTLLDERVRDGMICDGHGDLLADDIFCLDDGPRILDCIEFDDRLRHGDVLADVAFLAMDLERLGAPGLAAQLLHDYAEFSGEHHPASLTHYYIAARALIRAKVTAVRVHQGDTSVAPLAVFLLALTRTHLRSAQVTCVLVGGAPGTGKSTFAHALAPFLDAVVCSSDEVRKDLAGLPHDTRAEAAYGAGIYDAAHTEATYDALADRARRLLARGVSVILDASWTRRARREAVARIARATSSDLIALRCVVPDDVAARRIAARRATGTHVSDTTADIARAMRVDADPWPEAVEITTAGTIDSTVARARRAIDESRGFSA